MSRILERIWRAPTQLLGEGGNGTVKSDGAADRVIKVSERTITAANAIEKITKLHESLKGETVCGHGCDDLFLRLSGVSVGKNSVSQTLLPQGFSLLESDGDFPGPSCGKNDGPVACVKKTQCSTSWGNDGRLRPEAVVDAMKDLATALYCMHRAGLAHGDVKPGQVIMDCRAGVLRSLLADYDTLVPFSPLCQVRPSGLEWSISTPYFTSPQRAKFQQTFASNNYEIIDAYVRSENKLEVATKSSDVVVAKREKEAALKKLVDAMPHDTYDAVADDLYALRKTLFHVFKAAHGNRTYRIKLALRSVIDSLKKCVHNDRSRDEPQVSRRFDEISTLRYNVADRWMQFFVDLDTKA